MPKKGLKSKKKYKLNKFKVNKFKIKGKQSAKLKRRLSKQNNLRKRLKQRLTNKDLLRIKQEYTDKQIKNAINSVETTEGVYSRKAALSLMLLGTMMGLTKKTKKNSKKKSNIKPSKFKANTTSLLYLMPGK